MRWMFFSYSSRRQKKEKKNQEENSIGLRVCPKNLLRWLVLFCPAFRNPSLWIEAPGSKGRLFPPTVLMSWKLYWVSYFQHKLTFFSLLCRRQKRYHLHTLCNSYCLCSGRLSEGVTEWLRKWEPPYRDKERA